MSQPHLVSTDGVMITVGFKNTPTGERSAMVFPMAADGRTNPPSTNCFDAVDSFVPTILPLIQPCFSSDGEITFVSGEAMVNGNIPYRLDFAAGTWPGTRGAAPAPDQVAALLAFYGDPSQVPAPPHDHTRVGKNYIPIIAQGDIGGDTITPAVVSNMVALATALWDTGIPPNAVGQGTWYRVVKQVRTPATALQNVIAGYARAYVCTQRRRLLPR